MELETDVSSISIKIEMIIQYLDTLNSISSNNHNLLAWFKKLCELLTNILVVITNLYKNSDRKTKNEDMLLYLNQLMTSLSLLMNIFVRECEAEQHLIVARNFCLKQMKWCLDGIKETLLNKSSCKDTSGSFIKWMDLALDKMNGIDFENQKSNSIVICEEAKSLFEEVLSHAMSIAQVALVEDCKIIRGRSQAVLEALDGLTSEMSKEPSNVSMINLFIESCSNELCALERRVNTAVLKLSLNVFSQYATTLESIHRFCFDRKNEGKLNELDALVVEYDLHVDRIMQIGLFAVSCSTCTYNCTKIKSCLASLEALEIELVPSFTSVLIDPSPRSINQTLLLKEHWMNQALILKKLIFSIIDPIAFCQVIYEENKALLEDISDKVKSRNSLLDKVLLENILKHSMVLKDFMEVILNEQEEPITEKTKKEYQDFKNVFHELHSASEILPDGENNNLRILKRGKILLTTIKNVWKCFLENDENESPTTTVSERQIDEANIQLIGNPFLDHLISRGKQILKDSSILHRSSLKTESCDIELTALKKISQIKGKSLPLSRLVHLRKLSFMNSVTKSDSGSELQMTDIINEINNITNSEFLQQSRKNNKYYKL
nr:serendipity locus protein alpha [Leptinotarsa decemlineata]